MNCLLSTGFSEGTACARAADDAKARTGAVRRAWVPLRARRATRDCMWWMGRKACGAVSGGRGG